MTTSKKNPDEKSVHRAILSACDRRFGVLDHNFICQSVGVLNPPAPHCVPEHEKLENVVALFQEKSVGSVLVTKPDGTLAGIFTERDCVRKALPDFERAKSQPISAFMTPDPVAQPPDITVAFALNLMAEGGFRHLPLVDASDIPIGIISVRDMMDFIVRTFVEELMNFETEAPESRF